MEYNPHSPTSIKRFQALLVQIGAEQGYLLDLVSDGTLAFRLKLNADGSSIETETDLIIPAIVNTAIQTQKGVIIRNAMTDHRFANEWDVMRLKIRSVMCVPLWDGDNIVSLVYVENRSKAGCFSQTQTPLIEALGNKPEQQKQSQSRDVIPIAHLPEKQDEEGKPTSKNLSETSPNKRYILHEKIGQGGMGVVHRATDRLTGEIIALKQVRIPAEQLQFMTRVDTETKQNLRVSLAREFQILAGLRHPNIISVLDYGFTDKRLPYFSMTYLPKSQTFLEAGKHLPTSDKVELFRQLLQALAYLHRRGIIHRDLKPNNVLVDKERVQVLDFGLSFEQKTGLTSAGGTLLYMAPEIVLEGQPASFASDLYAVGVMAYELFAGRHPFNTTGSQFAQQLRDDTPHLGLLDVDKKVAAVIGKLLAKAPEDRFKGQIDETLNVLRLALGEGLPKESSAIRESYLQAATFVGRDAELGQLQAALVEAKIGQSSAWLIGGESGVGKSRLIEEFRTLALISGWQVLRGQGISGGGVPYQLWRSITPHLVLDADLTELEASILREVTPKISQLLGYTVSPAPELTGSAAQQRLVLTLIDLLKRQQRPILLLLEDLQWAEESLHPLKQILGQLAQMPQLLIVGTYRDDEQPNLPQTLPQSHHLSLKRLPDEAVAQLSQAILGEQASHDALVNLLQQETEGNTYFIVEVMRALAEEAGQLANIGEMALPQHILTHGMSALLQNRLQKIPAQDQSLLRLAAVSGRQIDPTLLQLLAPQMHLDNWLQRNAEAAVLTVQENQWQFSHDKLRETLLAQLTPEQRQNSHRQVALAIEKAYPEDDHYNEILLAHWQMADDEEKELHYLFPVGLHLIKISDDYVQAIDLMERSLALLSPNDNRRVQALNNLADIYWEQGEVAKVEQVNQQAH
ncbi:MAG: protein kinase, partial [Chloroflexota bacterium]